MCMYILAQNRLFSNSFSFRKHCAIAGTKERLVTDKKFVLVQSVARYFPLKENF